ncbi:MAG: tetratricopeptide repeat protein [Cyanobacteriota/Melainabacteria group bacterium]
MRNKRSVTLFVMSMMAPALFLGAAEPASAIPLLDRVLSKVKKEPDAQKGKEKKTPALGGVDELNPEKASKIEKHLKLGDMFFKRRDLTNAMLEYEDVVKVDPDNFKAHFMLGKVLMAMSDFEEALKEYEKLTELRLHLAMLII